MLISFSKEKMFDKAVYLTVLWLIHMAGDGLW